MDGFRRTTPKAIKKPTVIPKLVERERSSRFHVISQKNPFPNLHIDGDPTQTSTITSISYKNAQEATEDEESCEEDVEELKPTANLDSGSFKKVSKWLEKTPSQTSFLSSDVSIIQHDSVPSIKSSAYLKKHSKGIFIEHNGHKLPFPKLTRTNLEDHQKRILDIAASKKGESELKDAINDAGEAVWTTGIIVGTSQHKLKKSSSNKIPKMLSMFTRKKGNQKVSNSSEGFILLRNDVSSPEGSIRETQTQIDGKATENASKILSAADEPTTDDPQRTSTGTSFLIYDCENDCFVKETMPDSYTISHDDGENSRDDEIARLSRYLQDLQNHNGGPDKPQMRTIFSYRQPPKAAEEIKTNVSKSLYKRLTNVVGNFFNTGAKLIQTYGSNVLNMFRFRRRRARVTPHNSSAVQNNYKDEGKNYNVLNSRFSNSMENIIYSFPTTRDDKLVEELYPKRSLAKVKL